MKEQVITCMVISSSSAMAQWLYNKGLASDGLWWDPWPRSQDSWVLMPATHQKLNHLGKIIWSHWAVSPWLNNEGVSDWWLCTFLPVFDSLLSVGPKKLIPLRSLCQKEQLLSPSIFSVTFPLFSASWKLLRLILLPAETTGKEVHVGVLTKGI